MTEHEYETLVKKTMQEAAALTPEEKEELLSFLESQRGTQPGPD